MLSRTVAIRKGAGMVLATNEDRAMESWLGDADCGRPRAVGAKVMAMRAAHARRAAAIASEESSQPSNFVTSFVTTCSTSLL